MIKEFKLFTSVQLDGDVVRDIILTSKRKILY